ncbi:MAG TPA: M20 family metallopeptidase [Streptosporangiaceae bacterium]|nr:M20 family metallopeptidase [Streptosporangiaceae bacterium]
MTAKDQARSRIAAAADQVLELSHTIHAHPETAWQEHQAAGWLTEALERLGYAVTRGACQLPTAFTASIGTGDLNIGICAEYDALPGLGHACGHNIIAAAAIGAATGLAGVADQLGLTVTVLGTPAEEGGGGKIVMLDRGAFDGLHAAMMIHPGPADAARAEPLAVDHQHISYRGKTAHASAYPELGVNAADAFTIAQVAIGLLRQQLPGSVRVHGIVTHAGLAPNAIPDRAEGRWYVRASSLAELDRIGPRVRACFEAGALATGCELAIEPESPRYSEFRNDEQLLDLFVANARELGRPFTDPGAGAGMNRASTDMGNVSLRLPAIHPYLGIDSLPAVNHQPEFAAHCAGPAADRAVLDGAIALAAVVIDTAIRDGVRGRLLAASVKQN